MHFISFARFLITFCETPVLLFKRTDSVGRPLHLCVLIFSFLGTGPKGQPRKVVGFFAQFEPAAEQLPGHLRKCGKFETAVCFA